MLYYYTKTFEEAIALKWLIHLLGCLTDCKWVYEELINEALEQSVLRMHLIGTILFSSYYPGEL